ncbi:MAG: helix-turn-helix domain-containing protein [Candidatus Acidiferrales bacterium]
MAPKSIPKVSIRQLKAARALLAWSQEELAAAAHVSIPTIKRLEAQDGPLGGRNETGTKIRSALESAGIEFIDENGGGPGVRLRKRPPRG